MGPHRIDATLFCVVLLLALSPSTAGAQTCAAGQECTPPDVTGAWHTRHSFDISSALPPELKNGFVPLRNLNQAIVDRFDLGPRHEWLEPIIGSQIDKHVSPWLQAIIRIGDDLGTILGTLRSEGALRLTKGVDFVNVKGSEVWTSLISYWLPLCGDNIGGDPRLPPECARFDIATSDNDVPGETPQVKTHVGPIAATVRLSPDAQAPRWQLVVDQHKVRLKIGKLVLVTMNELIQRATPWHGIEEATDCRSGSCVVDCAGLAASLPDADPVVRARVEAICAAAVRKAGRETMRALSRAWADAAVLHFDGSATISGPAKNEDACESKTGCAGMLGLAEYDLLLRKDPAHRDGSWTGSFFSKTLTNMPGAWHATREPAR